MATHSRILVWEIPWTEEPGGLQSMGSQKVRHDLAAKQSIHTHTDKHTHTHIHFQPSKYSQSQQTLLPCGQWLQYEILATSLSY